MVAIVGYTNAGKSTLLNHLTQSDVLAEDKLFATLDTRSRRIRFPREREVVISDTVGFIRDLPKDLFAAFRATFEEAKDADLLLHMVDASNPSRHEHIRTTEVLLTKLGISHIPQILVYNKIDCLDDEQRRQLEAQCAANDDLSIAACDPKTFTSLLRCMERMLFLAPIDEACLAD